jgi:hypothetical protein
MKESQAIVWRGVGPNDNTPILVKALDPRLKHRHLVDVGCGLFKGRFGSFGSGTVVEPCARRLGREKRSWKWSWERRFIYF